MTRRLWGGLCVAGWLALTASACPSPQPTPTPPAPQTYRLTVHVCDGPCVNDNKVPGAVVRVVDAPPNPNAGQAATTNGSGNVDGWALKRGGFTIAVDQAGYQHASAPVTLTSDQSVDLALTRAIPAPPTRADFINLHITFQGLMVNCPPYGTIPWFEAALAWASPDCRQNAYAAKHAALTWGPGDTHALIQLPFGPPLYDEPNQPYSRDRFGPLDWTAGDTAIDPKLADLVYEVLTAGFNRIIVVEGGDGPSDGTGAPYQHAMKELPLLHDALAHSKYGDLTPYVAPMPGWDSVFYGWEPSHVLIPNWVNACRSYFTYCVFEASTGHVPLGEGDQDWVGNGQMRGIDLLLQEFDDDRYDDSIWQIAARQLGPLYHRPPEQPASDDPGSPFGPTAGQFILRQPTERGPIAACAFEFHEYTMVHSNGDPAVQANTVRQRHYLQNVGYPCGG